jgi:hypothetical protein
VNRDDGDVGDVIEAQLKSQGVSCIAVEDGHVFTFTSETLAALVEKAAKTGKVALFVKRGFWQ